MKKSRITQEAIEYCHALNFDVRSSCEVIQCSIVAYYNACKRLKVEPTRAAKKRRMAIELIKRGADPREIARCGSIDLSHAYRIKRQNV